MKGLLRCNDKGLLSSLQCNFNLASFYPLGLYRLGQGLVPSFLYLHTLRKSCKFCWESYFNIFRMKEFKIVILNFSCRQNSIDITVQVFHAHGLENLFKLNFEFMNVLEE